MAGRLCQRAVRGAAAASAGRRRALACHAQARAEQRTPPPPPRRRRTSHPSLVACRGPSIAVDFVPYLEDNYGYLVTHTGTGAAVAVDVGDADAVLRAMDAAGVAKGQLKAVWTTHHHWDHVGGIEALLAEIPGLDVCGGDERIPHLTHLVAPGQRVEAGGIGAGVLDTRCHTARHVAFLLEDGPGWSCLFSGDALFVGGCGRFFEGTAADMLATAAVLQALPDRTWICPGHEYTLTNLGFACSLCPDDAHLAARLAHYERLRSDGLPTVPSTMALERGQNLFLRCAEPGLQAVLGAASPEAALARLRALKDAWKPT